MYPIGRLCGVLLQARKAAQQPFESVCETRFCCRPWDLDLFLEVNNGRQLTLYDLGRMDFSMKTGFSRELKKQQWGLVVAGSTVRYRKRIRGFDAVVMYTRWVGCDDRWFYMEQSMWVKGVPASSVLLRTCLLYTSPSPRDKRQSRMPSSA